MFCIISCPGLCPRLTRAPSQLQGGWNSCFWTEADRGPPFKAPGHFLGPQETLHNPPTPASLLPKLPGTWLFCRSISLEHKLISLIVVVVHSLSHVRLFVTPWTAARQASLSLTISRSWLKLMRTESRVPSGPPRLCCLLLPASAARFSCSISPASGFTTVAAD